MNDRIAAALRALEESADEAEQFGDDVKDLSPVVAAVMLGQAEGLRIAVEEVKLAIEGGG